MIKFCSKLKTSDKITFLFSLFNFIWLILLLLGVNIIYFLVWNSHQKEMSFSEIDNKYEEFLIYNNSEVFRNFILKNDTIIIPENRGYDIFCSNWIERKVHKTILTMKEKFYYKSENKIYFIFSKNYNWIWEVKILFDTTPYVEVQIMIIKFSLFLIFISLFIFYFIWKKITKFGFKNLEIISKQYEKLDIEKDFKKIKIIWNKNDEINILAETLNKSFCHIKTQASNLKQFTDDVAHEFKTPLMIVNSRIDLYNKKLEKKKLEKEDTDILLKQIKFNTKKLNDLLETFLVLSRAENKLEKLEKKEVDLWSYLKTITENYLINNNSSKKNINIKYNLYKDKKILLEENTFQILFENLFSNAIKFWKKDNIKIEIWFNKKSFWIKDNWIWISEKNLKNIWNKFFRNDLKIQWFGIWLFLVKRLVDLYNWEIDVESVENKWSKFIIKFTD